jgi:sec-independent protein translocase protein TatA
MTSATLIERRYKSSKPLATSGNGLIFLLTMSFLASLMNFGGPDLIIILLIVLVLFGAKKLPELAKGLGQAIKEFQKAKDEFSDELHKSGDATAQKPNVQPPQSTVARTDTAPAAQPDPNQNVNPGKQADQV